MSSLFRTWIFSFLLACSAAASGDEAVSRILDSWKQSRENAVYLKYVYEVDVVIPAQSINLSDPMAEGPVAQEFGPESDHRYMWKRRFEAIPDKSMYSIDDESEIFNSTTHAFDKQNRSYVVVGDEITTDVRRENDWRMSESLPGFIVDKGARWFGGETKLDSVLLLCHGYFVDQFLSPVTENGNLRINNLDVVITEHAADSDLVTLRITELGTRSGDIRNIWTCSRALGYSPIRIEQLQSGKPVFDATIEYANQGESDEAYSVRSIAYSWSDPVFGKESMKGTLVVRDSRISADAEDAPAKAFDGTIPPSAWYRHVPSRQVLQAEGRSYALPIAIAIAGLVCWGLYKRGSLRERFS